jgi:hypothetical protein
MLIEGLPIVYYFIDVAFALASLKITGKVTGKVEGF